MPVLLLDDRFNLKYFSKPAAKFLHLGERSGIISSSVQDMLPHEVSIALRQGVRELQRGDMPLWIKGIPLEGFSKTYLNLKISIHSPENQDTRFFVLLQETMPEEGIESPKNGEKQLCFDARTQSEEIQQLHQELEDTQAQLQAVIEEIEANNEELQAANEEMMSSNEELQSTNEELQSVNEELYTVNAELQVKNQELSEVNADIDNLLQSTEIGTIFIDENGYLRKFTSKVQEQFNIQKEDIGRPIAHFTHSLNYPELHKDIQQVMKTGHATEREVVSHDLNSFVLV